MSSRRPERIERFFITITRPTTPGDAVRDVVHEWQSACDGIGVPYGFFRILNCQPGKPGTQEVTLVHERGLDWENEVFERTTDPSDDVAVAQVLSEYAEAKHELGLPWLDIQVTKREVDATGTWLSTDTPTPAALESATAADPNIGAPLQPSNKFHA